METIYANPAYRASFETEQSLRAKVAELQVLEGKQRIALGQWLPPITSQKSAFARAVQSLNGEPAQETANTSDLKALQAAHVATKHALDALMRGLPEALQQVTQKRDALTGERLEQADVRKAIKRTCAAVRELLAADLAMNELCDSLSRSGFATGQNERDALVLTERGLLEAWADQLQSMQG